MRGFSLIELMVGVVIGMIAVILISQVFALSEGTRRTTLGVDDATSNGAVALVGLQRDLRQGGYGLSALQLSGCNLALPAGWTVNGLAPVTINHPDIPAGDDNTDTLLITYGASNSTPDGDRVVSQPAAGTYSMSAHASFTANDQVIAVTAAPPVPCDLTVEVSTPLAAPNVTVATGVADMANGTLFNVGPQPRFLAYAIRGGNLTLCDYAANDCSNAADVDDEAVWVPVASNIVSLRAEYGRDTSGPPMDATVDLYDQTTPALACDWARVSAVRVVLVARSGQLEREDVTPAALVPTWAGSTVTLAHPVAVPIDLTANDDWQRFRYRTFETTVPLRNMAWLGVQAGC